MPLWVQVIAVVIGVTLLVVTLRNGDAPAFFSNFEIAGGPEGRGAKGYLHSTGRCKKRSVTLPPGCKDLIDVLRSAEEPEVHGSISTDQGHGVVRGGSVKGKLSEIGKWVARVFRSKAHITILMMAAPDERLTIDLVRAWGAIRMFSVKFNDDAGRESAVRAFFERHHLWLPEKTGVPGHFSPHLPVQCIYPVSPLPSDSAMISGLATELFRDFCRLDDKAELRFCYYERTKPF